jgi:hypothetical protein
MLRSSGSQKQIALRQTSKVLGLLHHQLRISLRGIIPAGFVERLATAFVRCIVPALVAYAHSYLIRAIVSQNSYLFEDADCRDHFINIRLLRIMEHLAARYSKLNLDDRTTLRYRLRLFWPVACEMVHSNHKVFGKYQQILETLGVWESLTPPGHAVEGQDEVHLEVQALPLRERYHGMKKLDKPNISAGNKAGSLVEKQPDHSSTSAPPPQKRKTASPGPPVDIRATFKRARVSDIDFVARDWVGGKQFRLEERRGADRVSGYPIEITSGQCLRITNTIVLRLHTDR